MDVTVLRDRVVALCRTVAHDYPETWFAGTPGAALTPLYDKFLVGGVFGLCRLPYTEVQEGQTDVAHLVRPPTSAPPALAGLRRAVSVALDHRIQSGPLVDLVAEIADLATWRPFDDLYRVRDTGDDALGSIAATMLGSERFHHPVAFTGGLDVCLVLFSARSRYTINRGPLHDGHWLLPFGAAAWSGRSVLVLPDPGPIAALRGDERPPPRIVAPSRFTANPLELATGDDPLLVLSIGKRSGGTPFEIDRRPA